METQIMNTKTRLASLTVLILITLPIAASGEQSRATEFPVDASGKIHAAPGAFIGQGRLEQVEGAEVCIFDPVSYGIAGSSAGSSTLETRITGDCAIVVAEPSSVERLTPSSNANSMRGYASDEELVFSFETRD
ncbi:MAG: hypothetical protein QM692_20445 [Thermomicrobiales bacterium]